jgi:hypothetical protein
MRVIAQTLLQAATTCMFAPNVLTQIMSPTTVTPLTKSKQCFPGIQWERQP